MNCALSLLSPMVKGARGEELFDETRGLTGGVTGGIRGRDLRVIRLRDDYQSHSVLREVHSTWSN
jgi:hypothetical protein